MQAFRSAAARGDRLLFISADGDPAVLDAGASSDGLTDLDRLVDSGALVCRPPADLYASRATVDDRRSGFEATVEDALAAGYQGLCVVADNSPFADGSDDEFTAWLAWEAAADELQSTAPINGVCYFDRDRVSAERIADISTLHPVVSADMERPTFQLVFDGPRVNVFGALETVNVDRIARVLASVPTLTEREFDLSGVEFVNHRGLLALARLAADDRPVRVHAAPRSVRRVWDLIGRPEQLEFVA